MAIIVQLPHNLIVGIARIGGTDFRYKIYFWDGAAYQKTTVINPALPILFKPMGTPKPEAVYIASDADYVDFITELMGDSSIPPEVKELRKGKQYLLLGMRLNRDTERMVMADLIYSAAEPAGWVFIAEPTEKEKRYCKKIGLEIIDADILNSSGPPSRPEPVYKTGGNTMLLNRYEPYFFNSNFREAASEAGWEGYRGELIVVEGEVTDDQGRRKPPVALFKQAAVLAKGDEAQADLRFAGGLAALAAFHGKIRCRPES